jgi:ketosteroid isomerase-like protein
MMTTKELVQSYYDSLIRKDSRWQDLYSDEAVFSDASNTLLAEGKQAVIQSFAPFLKGVAGLNVSQAIFEGEKACFIISYVYVNSKKEQMKQDVAEMWEVRGGKLARLTIYFDLTAYRRFMQG